MLYLLWVQCHHRQLILHRGQAWHAVQSGRMWRTRNVFCINTHFKVAHPQSTEWFTLKDFFGCCFNSRGNAIILHPVVPVSARKNTWQRRQWQQQQQQQQQKGITYLYNWKRYEPIWLCWFAMQSVSRYNFYHKNSSTDSDLIIRWHLIICNPELCRHWPLFQHSH